ncbi:hypothetical protein NVS89_04415 [Ancylobacter sp. MQZ15Z-1]|uniref:Uncharacterized protein n=1 Tax=Ancylobacter mangrovi TaxID=2972472 RepID=A0A9X2T0V9_9HYPH|nr:hypothetical protein [Ancylobacter mangrovi]MCS0494330.1 hypothetical protein [Ancylobacter mangrovi]
METRRKNIKSKARGASSTLDRPLLNCAAYDGLSRIGSVREIGRGEYEAIDLAGSVVGRFRTLKAAAASLSTGDSK